MSAPPSSIAAELFSILNGTRGYNCDVFIYGATIGGCLGAIRAKRLGLDVVLAERDRRHFGGMQTGGLSFQDTPSSPTGLGPMMLEYYTRVAAYYGITVTAFMATSGATQHANGEPKIFKRILGEMLSEAGVEIAFGRAVEKVQKSGAYIQAVTLSDGSIVHAKRYQDSTYECDLMLRSGCSFKVGREANATYSETYNGATALIDLVTAKPIDPYVTAADPTSGLLPNVVPVATTVAAADSRVPGYNYRLCMSNAADRIAPWDPPVYNALDYEYLGRLFAASAITGLSSIFTPKALIDASKQDWNTNGAIGTNLYGPETWNYPLADYATRDEYALRLKNYILGLFKFIREDSRIDGATKAAIAAWGFARDEFTETENFPPQVYVREAARLVGDFVMSEADIENDSNLDGIAYAAYDIDSHFVSLVASGGVLKVEGKTAFPIGHYYQIPYRAILPKAGECENLTVTYGISCTHPIMASQRMEYVHGALGEAAACAAALSIQQGKTLRDLHPSYVQAAMLFNPAGILMDPLAASGNGAVVTTGAWTRAVNQYGLAVHGQAYVHDNAAGKNTKSIKFTPTLPAGGSYDVWLKFKEVNDASRSNAVPVTVQRSGGTSSPTVNQKVAGAGINTFALLGTYTFVGDGSDYIQIGNNTAAGTYVCVDAVCFSPKFPIL